MTFYEDLADDYDDITSRASRAESASAFVAKLTERCVIRSAVDVACGTGMYALALAELGVATVGADISAGMLAKARSRALQAGLAVQWIQAPMQELSGRMSGRVDVVLCMGNSLPHLLDDGELDKVVLGFRDVLVPGGTVAIHVLNYDRILAYGERIVGITRQGGRQYIRFYDFLGDRVRFNVLTVEWSDDEPIHKLHSVMLRPYCHAELRTALAGQGFSDIQAFGDLALTPFRAETSSSLLLTAHS